MNARNPMPVAREGGPARDEHGRPTPIETRRVMIECRDVHKYYGDYHALRGIDLTIREAEFFSLLGPSGCGKTTLLRTIAGFEDISSGVVLIVVGHGLTRGDAAPRAATPRGRAPN